MAFWGNFQYTQPGLSCVAYRVWEGLPESIIHAPGMGREIIEGKHIASGVPEMGFQTLIFGRIH